MKKLFFGAYLSAFALACSPNHNEAERWEEAAYLPPPSGSLSCEEYAIHKDEFEWVRDFWEFEGVAEATYTYTDKTSEIFVANDTDDTAPGSFGYEPATLTDPTVCHGEGTTQVLRLVGKEPFLNWGGGAGRRLAGSTPRNACPTFPSDDLDPLCPKLNPDIEAEVGDFWSQNYYLAVLDLSEWEGVSFWARRGERAQPGIRINLADIRVDDDVSYLMSGYGVEPYCRRAVSCDCSGDRRCVQKGAAEYCLTPEEEALFDAGETEGLRLDRCGRTKCEATSETFMGRIDPAFGRSTAAGQENRDCQPYYFRSDVQSIYNTPDINHCYDAENGPFPAENYEKCGDNWMHSVYLTTEWKFYRVPFSAFQQQGWAMKSARLDVANLTMIRFTWAAGRVDHYFDAVRFYRRKR